MTGVFSLAFYFLEYAMRSCPAVMIPQLVKTIGVSTLGVSDIEAPQRRWAAGSALASVS